MSAGPRRQLIFLVPLEALNDAGFVEGLVDRVRHVGESPGPCNGGADGEVDRIATAIPGGEYRAGRTVSSSTVGSRMFPPQTTSGGK